MTKNTKLLMRLLITSLLVTIGLFVYLSVHHFALKLGLSGNSLCEINSQFNCDAAATSNFAEFLNVPIAILGGVFHLVLLSFIIFYNLGWAESTSYLRISIRGMLAVSVAVSIIAGAVSLFTLKVLCPFCVATYVFSVINLILGWNLVQNYSNDFKFINYFKEHKSLLMALISIPVLSWFISGMIQSNYGLDQIKKQVPEKIAIWKASSEYNFDKNLGLSNAVVNPRMTLIEFADFKCPHCKIASNTIKVFLKGRPDIQFIFKPYPLDGNCNDAISQKGDNSRCLLAAMTLCAEKIAKKGWEMHHWIFEKQEKLIPISDIKTQLTHIQNDLGLDSIQMLECADSAEIYDVIKKTASEGTAARVEGTPTIYLNGKKLPWGHYLEVLKQASE